MATEPGSITSWMRLEPRCRDDQMEEPLRARVYDPLWLLARQWQVGEFQGEDGGTPVLARWRAQSAPLTRYRAGRVAAHAGGGGLTGANPPPTRVEAARFDVSAMPLEALVERQRVRVPDPADAESSLRLAAEDGLHCLRLLDAQRTSRSYRAEFVRRFAVKPIAEDQRVGIDAETLSYADLMAGRVPDGRLLAAAFRSAEGGPLQWPPGLDVADNDRAEVLVAVSEWLASHDRLFSEPESNSDAWIQDRMEYGFTVAGSLKEGETALTAEEYFEGRLDWHAMDVDDSLDLGSVVDNAAKSVVEAVIPAPVTFRGAPAQRFWEFEDARIDYGLLPAGQGDLVHLMLSEFATDYGNDWYVIPVDVEVGTLTRTRSLVITDTFGVKTQIRPVNDVGSLNAGWSMFELARRRRGAVEQPRPVSNMFFLAPCLGNVVEGRPSEEVLFLRDEMANMAWAVERAVQGRLEQRVDLGSAADTKPPEPASKNEMPRYRLATDVPANWTPLVPKRDTTVGGPLRLARAAMLTPDGSNAPREAKSLLLKSLSPTLGLFDEEVPREGVRVTRSYQYARWIGGLTVLWAGFRKQVGRGEGSSGLRFDSLEE